MRRRQRRVRGNLPAPEGLAGGGASAALRGLPIVPTMGRATRLASAPSPCQRGSRRLPRQAPSSGSAGSKPARGQRRNQQQTYQGGRDQSPKNDHGHGSFDFVPGLM